MTDQQFNTLLAAIAAIGETVAPAQWDNFLVTSGQVKPKAPTKAEVAANPGKYYKTEYDPITGPAPNIHVVLEFETRKQDDEGNDLHNFIGGSLAAWARADLPAFLRWYKHSTGYDLNLDNLHPAQRALMGI